MDIVEKKIIKLVNKHPNKARFIAFSKNGKYFISKSKTETIFWDIKTWEVLFLINEAEVGIVVSKQRYCKGIVHHKQYKPISDKMIGEYVGIFNEKVRLGEIEMMPDLP